MISALLQLKNNAHPSSKSHNGYFEVEHLKNSFSILFLHGFELFVIPFSLMPFPHGDSSDVKRCEK